MSWRLKICVCQRSGFRLNKIVAAVAIACLFNLRRLQPGVYANLSCIIYKKTCGGARGLQNQEQALGKGARRR